MNVLVKGLKLTWRGGRRKQLVSPAPSAKLVSYANQIQDSPTVSLSEDESSSSELLQEHVKSQSLSPKESSTTNTQVEHANSSKFKQQSVDFSTVEVREYKRILGDAPDCESYPLSIDWAYNHEAQVFGIDHHQRLGEERGRCTSVDMEPLSVHDRRLRLRAMGFTERELRQAERRRKVQQAHEWAYGQNHGCAPPSVTNKIVERYVR